MVSPGERTYIVPLATKLIDDAEPLRIRLAATAGLRRDSDLLLDQVRAIDNRRLIGASLFTLPAPVMKRVAKALGELLALDE